MNDGLQYALDIALGRHGDGEAHETVSFHAETL
jgi:hypothetical protein